MRYNEIIIIFASILGSLALFQSTSFAASDTAGYKTLSDGINVCSSEENDSTRLKCYDALAQGHVETDAKKVAPSGALPKNLGGGKFEDRKKDPEQSVVGLVKSCQKSQDGRWFYIFEDGQVWKQVDRVKRRYKECKFSVTIKKDGFGYKMRIADQTSTIRIRRHR